MAHPVMPPPFKGGGRSLLMHPVKPLLRYMSNPAAAFICITTGDKSLKYDRENNLSNYSTA